MARVTCRHTALRFGSTMEFFGMGPQPGMTVRGLSHSSDGWLWIGKGKVLSNERHTVAFVATKRSQSSER